MTLTAGGSRLLATASQIVVLGAEAHAAVRAAQGAPEQLRLVASPTFAEFVASPLTEAFRRRFAGPLEVSSGVAVTHEMAVLVGNRLADVAIGPSVASDPGLPVVSEPIFRYRLVVVTAGQSRLRGSPASWRWLVDPSGTDPESDTGQLLAALRIPEDMIGVFPNQTAAWAAAADGAGVAPAVEHLVTQQLRRGELSLVDVPGTPVDGVLARDPAGAPAPEHGGQRPAPLPDHAGGDAADARAHGRRPAVAVPAAGLRDDLELIRPGQTREPGGRRGAVKQDLIHVLRTPAGCRIMWLTSQEAWLPANPG